MKVLTIRLDPGSGADVLDALGKLVQQKRPEFLAVQNVTNDQVKKILKSTWGTPYKVTHPAYRYETRKNPTVAIFSTYPEEDSVTVSYHESATKKVLQKSYYIMYDKRRKSPYVISVGSTTLESGLKESEVRERQLNEACLSMIDDGDAFLVGDFSLDNDIDGALLLKGGWEDAWLAIAGNTESNGYTYNPDKNPLIKEDPFGPGRPDRIFLKLRHYSLDRVELVGVEPYQVTQGPAVTISSHYGLLAHLTPLDDPIPRAEPEIVAATFKRTEWSVQFQESSK